MSVLLAMKSEFQRIATEQSAGFMNKKMSELEDAVQNYDFAEPLINLVPIKRVRHNLGASSQMVYEGDVKLQFLTKAVKSDNFDETKDVLIDELFLLSEGFFRTFVRDNNNIFNNPTWTFNSEITRFITSNYLVGIETTVTFITACNRY